MPTPLLIDDWQIAGTDLLWTLKRLVDADPTPGRFILAGSVEPATYGPTYPLTGRAVRFVMRLTSMSELDGGGGQPSFIAGLAAGEGPSPTAGEPARFEMGWLTRAGFPAVRSMADTALFLEGHGALVPQRAGDECRNASRLLRTMLVLATLEGQAVPDQRIWESADINKATWKDYDDLLERTHLAVPSPAFERTSISTSCGRRRRGRTTIVPLHPPTVRTHVDINGWWVRIAE